MTTESKTRQYGAGYVIKESLRSYGARIWNGWQLFRREPVGMFGLVVIILFGVMAILHPILMATVWDFATYNPTTGFDESLTGFHPAPPSASHLLGTDPLGRDILSQLMFSARNAFVLAVIAAAVTLVVSTLVGAVSAYFPGVIDAFLMRTVDLVIMMPAVTILIVIGALWDLEFWSLAIVIGLLNGLGATALIIKSQALTVKVRPYIDAARVSGASNFRIIFSHIVPQLLPIAFLYMMFTVTGAIFGEAFLSFLGILNVDMSWGIMFSITRSQGFLLNFSTWWLTVPAGLAITLLSGSFYLVGRGLDPIVNPRLRER